MKNWHALLISASLISAAVMASGTSSHATSGVWGMVAGNGGNSWLWNSSTRDVYHCDSSYCRRITRFSE